MDHSSRQAILRYAAGIGLAATVAYVLAFPLSFVAPVLAASILSAK